MVDEKLTEKTENSSPALTDIMGIVDDPGGTPLSQKITYGNVINSGLQTVVGTVVAGDVTAVVDTASLTTPGIVEKATTAEINAGSADRVIGLAEFIASNFGKAKFGWVHTASDTAVTTGDGTDGIPIPLELNGFDIVDVLCTVHDKGITNTTDVQIRRRRAGSDVDVLTVKVTLGNEFFARDATVNTSNDDLATGDIIYMDVDAVHSGTAPNGLSCIVIARLP